MAERKTELEREVIAPKPTSLMDEKKFISEVQSSKPVEASKEDTTVRTARSSVYLPVALDP